MRHERGSALIAVLLLLMMMSALAATLAVSGRTETLVVRNHETSAQALAAAEAGLNHAVQVAVAYLAEIDPDNISTALDTLLANPSDLDIDLNTTIAIAGAADADAAYEVSVMDEDDPARGATGLTAASIGEDDVATTDNNDTLVIRATGHASNNTTVTLEALISPMAYGALVTDGDLTISGNVSIDGADGSGSVHSNGDITISGGSTDISGSITASGEYTGSASGSGGMPKLPLPKIEAIDYKDHADFILKPNGTMTNQAGTVLCTWSSKVKCNNWSFSSTTTGWTIGSGTSTVSSGTYYVEGTGGATVSGSPGSSASPVHISIIAEGSINVSGSPDFVPEDSTNILFVTDGDLEISGGLDTGDSLTTQGRILVHEQIKFSGNPSLNGQVIVENAEDIFTLVHTNAVSGHVEITYNGGLSSNVFHVSGWREIR